MAIVWITAQDTKDPSSQYATEAAEAASWILYKLSGEKYAGLRTATDWYGLSGTGCSSCLATDSMEAAGIPPHGHYFVSPSLVNTTTSRGLRLRGRPVRSVERVTNESGVDAPSASYKLVNSAYLVNTDMTCWNLASGVTVEYSYGVMPPAMGRMAAVKLANEFISLYSEDIENCTLPERVTSVSRQGISYTILDPQTFLQDGRTGVYEIDLFLAAANPSRAQKRPRVFSPDIPRGER